MKRFMQSGLVRTGMPVVALMLAGILMHGAVDLGYAKSPASPSLAETEVEWQQIVGIIAPATRSDPARVRLQEAVRRGTRHAATPK